MALDSKAAQSQGPHCNIQDLSTALVPNSPVLTNLYKSQTKIPLQNKKI